MKKNRQKLKITALAAVLALSFTGCGNAVEDALVPPVMPVYNPVEPGTVEVLRGDLKPRFSAKLELLGYEQSRYQFSTAEFEEVNNIYGLKLDEIHVSVGDRVHAGDVMVSFHSEMLDEQIRENEKKISEANLEIDHLKRVSAIDSDQDNSAEISRLNREIEVARLYISDVNEIYRKLNVISEVDGYVSYVNNALEAGYLTGGQDMVVVDRSDGIYATDKIEGFDFKAGETYTAEYGNLTRKLQVVDPPEGQSGDRVYFQPVDAEGEMLEKELKLEFELPVMKDVCYVNQRAIFKKNDMYFVYVVKENGMRTAVVVTPGDTVDNYRIIKEGLSGGEQLELP